jgi:hypothetical protein
MHQVELIPLQIEDQLLMMLILVVEVLRLDIQVLHQQVVLHMDLHQVMQEHMQEVQHHLEHIHQVLLEVAQVHIQEVHRLLLILTIALLAVQVQVLHLLQEVIQEEVVAVHLHHPLLRQVEVVVEVLQEGLDSN